MLHKVLKQNNNNNYSTTSVTQVSNPSIDHQSNNLSNSNITYSSAKSYLSEDFFSVTSNTSDFINMSSYSTGTEHMLNSDHTTPSIVDECQDNNQRDNSNITSSTVSQSTDDQYCTSSSISINNNPTNTPIQDGADIKNSRNTNISSSGGGDNLTTITATNSSQSSLANSERELNWSALNNKMKSIDKLDLKRGSILIEHLSEYNKLVSSQVILGEENLSESSNNTSEITDAVSVQLHIQPPSSPISTSQNPKPVQQLTQNQLDNIIMAGINLFNEKPKKGIEYFISHKLITKTPESVSEFLHLCPLLNKKSIGDYLGDIDPFCISTLESLIARFNFQDLDFDMALRQLLYCFRLPGEAQKIDRIMQRFANQFYKDNLKNVFEDPDAVYMLAFATILLNTDLHHPYIKPTMTKSKFAKSLYKINNGKDLPLEYLEDLYDRINVDEIKMDPTGALFPYAVKKGWLNIRVKGKVADKWSRKWCVLSQGTLFFFRKPTDQTPVRYLRPDTVITPQKETKGKKNCFILNHSSPPICVESMLKNSSIGTKLPTKFNPQLLIQQLASFGKEKAKEPKFWDSISEKMYSDQKFDTLQEVVDTDSVSSIDTLSETSSAYYDEDVSPASSISSTSPISNSLHYQQQKKKGFSLRLGNKKTKDQIMSMSEETSANVQFNQPTSSNNNSPSLSRPPKPINPSNPQPNHSLTQPRPTIYKTVSSSSLMRSSSISSFSLPSQTTTTTTTSATPTKPATTTTTTTTTNSTPTTTTTTTSTTTTSHGLPPVSSTLTTSSTVNNNNLNIDSLTKLQEKMIKSSSKRTNTCILNADTKRERDSWIRLILQEFTSASK
ncbi:hypothetical protein CYY_006386 [Polysphondylium violaceum]|uniref:SEC7 domain-containing protein n=1 Tax=Polysphondylium violaceum TaxID=133409 RepID=A0A8J4PRG7_9MYCE|nr:hypothetical protein CYY_006386 [Polysphondylium violaceum]